ncbi:UNVERIFIED_CONTAM: hypothetical protein GTU68_039500, partial [Idotea baltica]|nr:hypothetical protein [Idotea baltica]
LDSWRPLFLQWLCEESFGDPAHDLAHIKRVVASSLKLGAIEGANMEVLLPAAWLHDCVHVAKDSDERSQASLYSADRASELLAEAGYPREYIASIHHVIHAHSFSANIKPTTIEAKVLQDADRLDALGAIGLSRCLMLGGHMNKPLTSLDDPFCKQREANDGEYVLDHLFVKLLSLGASMKTNAGLEMARERTAFLQQFLTQLELELDPVA